MQLVIKLNRARMHIIYYTGGSSLLACHPYYALQTKNMKWKTMSPYLLQKDTRGAKLYYLPICNCHSCVIGMASVYYVRFTWKERMEVKVQNMQENMTNYAVISRQAHQEEVASLWRRHNKKLSDIS